MITYVRLLLLALVTWSTAHATELNSQAVFERYEDAVYQIRVINRETGKKSSIGSGFIYHRENRLATNYHVVSQYIEKPDDFELHYLAGDGQEGTLRLVAVDAVHDLALVEAVESLGTPLAIGEPPAKGAALFAMGNPLDLGLTIAAGTNGGVLSQTDASRILFSGSLNPGMSGGPTFDASGTVVGINVSTARNDISFIVPTRYLIALATTAPLAADEVRAQISHQIRAYQASHLRAILARQWPATAIRGVRVPGAISPTIRCWDASPKPKPENLHRRYSINCKNENDIFLNDKLEVGRILYEYAWLESQQLEPLRFYRLYQSLNNSQFSSRAGKDDVSRFTCNTRFVAVSNETLKATVCHRTYNHYEGLGDVLFTSAMVGHEDTGFIFNLDLSGTDYATALDLIERFLQELQWQN